MTICAFLPPHPYILSQLPTLRLIHYIKIDLSLSLTLSIDLQSPYNQKKTADSPNRNAFPNSPNRIFEYIRPILSSRRTRIVCLDHRI